MQPRERRELWWKAASFWNAIEQGRLFNPLNLFPSVRPPGTILVSYPFGLTADFHGYHFRSVFLPLLFVVVAVYIAAGRAQVMRNACRGRVCVADVVASDVLLARLER